MKRDRCDDDDDEPASRLTLGALPHDILVHILPHAYGFVPSLVLVCRTWLHVVLHYDGWFSLARQYYQCCADRIFDVLDHDAWLGTKEEWHRLRLEDSSIDGDDSLVPYGRLPSPDDAQDPAIVYTPWHLIIGRAHYTPFERASHMCTVTLMVLKYLEKYATSSDAQPFRNFIGRLLVAKFPYYYCGLLPGSGERRRPQDYRVCDYYGRIIDAEHWLVPAEPIDLKRSLVFRTIGQPLCRLWQAVVQYVQDEGDNVLVRRNFHWRDVCITFKEEGHRYRLVLWDEVTRCYITVYSYRDVDDNGSGLDDVVGERSYDETSHDVIRRNLRSMTTFISSLHDHFDPPQVLEGMKAKPKKWLDPKENKYYGMTDAEIFQLWEQVGQDASAAGTAMHLNLERKALGRPYETESKEYKLYEPYELQHVTGRLRPFRTEWMVWDQELMLCGSIDIVYEYEDVRKRGISPRDGKRHLVIGDYKRSKGIKMYNEWQSMNSETMAFTAGDCNYIHYTIQLCGYKYILEKNYGVVVDEMFLIVLHPNQTSYIKVVIRPPKWADQCDRMMDSIWAYRRRQLECARALAKKKIEERRQEHAEEDEDLQQRP
jgi:hypothetical protein